jgi:curved DNA-binding protein CbpA
MFKDYYAILEISQTATLFEVKTAYRMQAKKWHPDKNSGIDTTEKMKEINEAKLILTDEEARVRYDIEYLKFKSYQKAEEEKSKKSKQEQYQRTEKERTKEKTHTKQTASPQEAYSSYQFDDEVLKRWMENARKQAMRNLYSMVIEFRESSIIGFGTFLKTTFKFIVIAAIVLLIALILKSI